MKHYIPGIVAVFTLTGFAATMPTQPVGDCFGIKPHDMCCEIKQRELCVSCTGLCCPWIWEADEPAEMRLEHQDEGYDLVLAFTTRECEYHPVACVWGFCVSLQETHFAHCFLHSYPEEFNCP